MEQKWIYFGVFIDNDSKTEILKLLQKYNVTIPENWKMYNHHMTIAFNNNTQEAKKLYDWYKIVMGKNVRLYVNGIGISNEGIAVRVGWANPIANKIPHITVATPINGKPVNSNKIMNWFNVDPIILYGTIDQFVK